MAIDVITLDGPAGAGKSTLARQLATALGWRFLATGSMYRAMTLGLMRLVREAGNGQVPGDLTDDGRAAVLARVTLRTAWAAGGGLALELDGTPVDPGLLSGPDVTANVRYVADLPGVREQLVREQRRLGVAEPTVTEGRDQGSVVFPDARWKIYLTASIDARASRRLRDFESAGRDADIDRVRAEIRARDQQDETRAVGALRVPDGAVRLDTSDLTQDEALAALLAIVRSARRPT